MQEACRCTWERCTGSIRVVSDQQRLTGIFTGRDAVRTGSWSCACRYRHQPSWEGVNEKDFSFQVVCSAEGGQVRSALTEAHRESIRSA